MIREQNKILFVAFLIVVVVALTATWALNHRASHTPKLELKPTVDSLINVHGSKRRELKVCGRTFSGISASGPGYSPIKNSSYILFVYHEGEQRKTLIILDTNTCTFTEILLTGVEFSGDFRSRPSPDQKIADYVEDFRSNQVFLVSKTFSYFERSVVDLEKASIKVIFLDVFDKRLDLLTSKTSQGVTAITPKTNWAVIAFVDSIDKETHNAVYAALKREGIECTWSGSIVYGLYVPGSNATQALHILQQTEAFKDRRVRLEP